MSVQLIYIMEVLGSLKLGKPASESLNLTMKSLRESEKFHDIKYWAPFVLIGDDITLDFIDIT